MKRILFLVPRMNIGGAETYVYTAAKELRARGYEVFLASGGGRKWAIRKCYGKERILREMEKECRKYRAEDSKWGEELFGIARRFHVSPAQILTANGLEAGTQVLPQAMHFLVPGA